MALTKFTDDVEIIQALSNTPNATEGLTADQLKAKFDEATGKIKTFLNDTLTEEVDTAVSDIEDLDTTVSGLVTTVSGLVTTVSGLDTGKVNKADIVDNLTTNDATKVLSANQGKVLNDIIDGVVLYNNSSGTAGNVTLSDNLSNYEYIEIYYMNNNGSYYAYTKTYNPNGKTISTSTYENLNLRTTAYNLSGTLINFVSGIYQELPTGTTLTGNYIKITRVVGYK